MMATLVCLQKREAMEKLQNNLKGEYRAVVEFDVAFFQTVRPICFCHCSNPWQVLIDA